MMTFTVDHLHLICRDLPEMIHFWTQGVGASFKQFREFGGAEGAVLMLDGLQLNLRVARENENRDSGTQRVLGYDHIGFRVADLDASCARLMEFGCKIHTGPTELSDRRIVFLKGPEAITIELMQLF